MPFTRRTDTLRICILCLDPSLIPEYADNVLIKDGFYNLRFQVEGMPVPPPLVDVRMGDAPKDDDHDMDKSNSDNFNEGKEAKNLGNNPTADANNNNQFENGDGSSMNNNNMELSAGLKVGDRKSVV